MILGDPVKRSFNSQKGHSPQAENCWPRALRTYTLVLYVRVFPKVFNWEVKVYVKCGTTLWTEVLGWIKKEKSSWTPAIPSLAS